MYPQRDGEVVTYYRPNTRVGAPEKPRTVRWSALDLTGTQTIEIKAKPGSEGVFPPDVFKLTAADPTKTTVEPRKGPDPKAPVATNSLDWLYTVSLLDGGGNVLYYIDPEIVVKNDP